ncbi:MAG: preprotein translocase subunit SecG [Clostridiales bacterium]|nr:preprotein translocase subunit SecG [Clostridiales bacterium]
MGIFEIIGGVLLVLFGLAVIISVTLQEHKTNLGGALGGSMNEGTYDRGRTKTMDAQLSMISKYSGVALCVVALAVLAAKIYL